jgi:hypothetical protein
MDLSEIILDCIDWIDMTQDKNEWRALEKKKIMEMRVP